MEFLYNIFISLQPGTNIQTVLKQKWFTEPRLVIFANKSDLTTAQGFVCAEKLLFFEVTEFSVISGIVSLIAAYYCYYVRYPKPLAARMFLLFIQEMLLEEPDDTGIRRSAKFTELVNYVL